MKNVFWNSTLVKVSTAVALLFGAVSCALAQTIVRTQPVLQFVGTEKYQVRGQAMIRYRLAIWNRAAFPDHLFEWTTAKKNPSRTWVNIYDEKGRYIYGFSALGSSQDLAKLWFAKKIGERPPVAVYVELHDRFLNVKYRSNLVLIRAFP